MKIFTIILTIVTAIYFTLFYHEIVSFSLFGIDSFDYWVLALLVLYTAYNITKVFFARYIPIAWKYASVWIAICCSFLHWNNDLNKLEIYSILVILLGAGGVLTTQINAKKQET